MQVTHRVGAFDHNHIARAEHTVREFHTGSLACRPTCHTLVMHEFSAADLDAYASRAVDKITTLARRASRFGTIVLLFAVLACGVGFLLGLQAFGSDSTGWWIIGGFGVVVGVGSALLGRWRLGSVKRHVPELVGEVRTMLTDGRQAGARLIDTFVVTDPQGAERFEARIDSSNGIELTRTLWGYKGLVGSGTQAFARLTSAVSALTSYPLLALLSVLTALGFCGLSVIFLLVIAF
jgi:hypothetical protein